jgi:phosphate uptake regulator
VSMARIEYQQSLHALEASLQEQGAVVLSALRGAVDAMQTQDVELCDEVVAFDDEIDTRYHRIEKTIEEILAQRRRSRPTSGSCSRCSTRPSTSSGSATRA